MIKFVHLAPKVMQHVIARLTNAIHFCALAPKLTQHVIDIGSL